MWGKRTAALILCAMMALMVVTAIPKTALAAGVEINYSAGSSFQIVGNQAIIQFEVANDSGGQITVNSFTASPLGGGLGTPTVVAPTSIDATIDHQANKDFTVVLSVSGSSNGTFPVEITATATTTTSSVEAKQTFLLTRQGTGTEDKTGDDTVTDPTAALMLSSVGEDGAVIPGPRGDAGDSIQIRLPIYNRSNSRLKEILVTPQISATLDSFPFVIEAVNYTCSLDAMRAGELKELAYNFKLSKDVTSGVKEVKFSAVYFNYAKQAYETATFSVFVTVVKGATPSLTDEDGVAITSTPKIIIESYSVEPANPADAETGRLFAGEQFALKLTVRNTSGEESVKNIQLTLSNEGGVILPADNGSNTVYIDRIGAGESVEKTIHFQSAPDAEAKAHSLSAKFSYESAKTLKTYEVTETITLPVSQRMRVRVDDPVVYGDGTVDQSMPMYFSLYNMGKSSLYNCMVDVEGDGLRMEESFFGGNVSTGSTMRADFNIISSKAGQIEGKIIITYEDVYGEETRVEKPFTVNVMEAYMPEDMGGDVFKPGFEEELKPQTPIGLYIAIGAAVLAAVAVLLVVLKRKRRKRQLEDV